VAWAGKPNPTKTGHMVQRGEEGPPPSRKGRTHRSKGKGRCKHPHKDGKEKPTTRRQDTPHKGGKEGPPQPHKDGEETSFPRRWETRKTTTGRRGNPTPRRQALAGLLGQTRANSRPASQPANQPRATCHVPRVTCHVPRATCHMPRATCYVPRATCHVPRPPSARGASGCWSPCLDPRRRFAHWSD
jgi:hypothetical protein